MWTLAVYDDGAGPALYVGGDFYTAGGVTVNYIARWDGAAWSALSGLFDTGVDDRVSALAVYNHSSGPALFVGGYFMEAGGLPSDHIAEWRCFPGLVFSDGFESGDTSNWSATIP